MVIRSFHHINQINLASVQIKHSESKKVLILLQASLKYYSFERDVLLLTCCKARYSRNNCESGNGILRSLRKNVESKGRILEQVVDKTSNELYYLKMKQLSRGEFVFRIKELRACFFLVLD